MRYRSFAGLGARPEPADRLFRSEALEQLIAATAAKIGDPDLRRLFEQCLPNSLDTTVYFSETEAGPDTFIVTGDIAAMWLRDSTNQVLPYLRLAASDDQLRKLFAGLIRRQAQLITYDPYANAFGDLDITARKPNPYWGGGPEWKKDVFERKYELDSLCAFFRLSTGYHAATKDTAPFNPAWLEAVEDALTVIELEQETITKDTIKNHYHFTEPDGRLHPAIRVQGYGYPAKRTGLSRTVFRPSDDEAVFPYNVPANAMAVVTLRELAPLLAATGRPAAAKRAAGLVHDIAQGIRDHGVVKHHAHGFIFAYEVDGFGSYCLMDDPNSPSLLSLPYLGYCAPNDPVYQATRRYILSAENPFYAKGKTASGLTSPHTHVLTHFWPIATIMRALTSDDDAEIRTCLETLKTTHAGTFFMHESINVDDPSDYTRAWFGWANSLFGELILRLADERPELLKDN